MTTTVTSVLDQLNPPYGEEPRIILTLADPLAPIFPRRPCRIQITTVENGIDRCAPYGLQLPIEILITGPRGESDFKRIVDRRIVRKSLTWTPKGAGRHTVVMREAAHNRWFGSLDVVVLGDRAQDPEP